MDVTLRVLRDVSYIIPLAELEERLGPTLTGTPAERRAAAEREYRRYVDAFRSEDGPNRGEATRFFSAHRDEEWLAERYSPEGRARGFARRAAVAAAERERFFATEIDWDTLTVPGLVMEIPDPEATRPTNGGASKGRSEPSGRKASAESGAEPPSSGPGAATAEGVESGERVESGAGEGGKDTPTAREGEREGGSTSPAPGPGDGAAVEESDTALPDASRRSGVEAPDASEGGDERAGSAGRRDLGGDATGAAAWCAGRALAGLSLFIKTVPARATRSQVKPFNHSLVLRGHFGC